MRARADVADDVEAGERRAGVGRGERGAVAGEEHAPDRGGPRALGGPRRRRPGGHEVRRRSRARGRERRLGREAHAGRGVEAKRLGGERAPLHPADGGHAQRREVPAQAGIVEVRVVLDPRERRLQHRVGRRRRLAEAAAERAQRRLVAHLPLADDRAARGVPPDEHGAAGVALGRRLGREVASEAVEVGAIRGRQAAQREVDRQQRGGEHRAARGRVRETVERARDRRHEEDRHEEERALAHEARAAPRRHEEDQQAEAEDGRAARDPARRPEAREPEAHEADVPRRHGRVERPRQQQADRVGVRRARSDQGPRAGGRAGARQPVHEPRVEHGERARRGDGGRERPAHARLDAAASGAQRRAEEEEDREHRGLRRVRRVRPEEEGAHAAEPRRVAPRAARARGAERERPAAPARARSPGRPSGCRRAPACRRSTARRRTRCRRRAPRRARRPSCARAGRRSGAPSRCQAAAVTLAASRTSRTVAARTAAGSRNAAP